MAHLHHVHMEFTTLVSKKIRKNTETTPHELEALSSRTVLSKTKSRRWARSETKLHGLMRQQSPIFVSQGGCPCKNEFSTYRKT